MISPSGNGRAWVAESARKVGRSIQLKKKKRTHAHFACWVCALVCFLSRPGCHSEQEVPASTSNITLTADHSCLIDSVPKGTIRHYPLDFRDRFHDYGDGWLNVKLFLNDVAALDGPDRMEPLLELTLDPTGIPPSHRSSVDGTVFADVGDDDGKNYTWASFPLSDFDEDLPWYASVYAHSNVSFLLRAWCTAKSGCENSCSEEAERCVNVGLRTCEPEVAFLEPKVVWDEMGEHSLAMTEKEDNLLYGEWNFYKFEVEDNDARILVELCRADGDLALFLKPALNGSAIPSENDFETYADKRSFRNQLNYHSVYHIGGGTFYVGVLNNDGCVQKESSYNLTVTIASWKFSHPVCPMNCNYPQGTCLRDGVCECSPGYGGELCEGLLVPARVAQRLSGYLGPGETAYFELDLEEVSADQNLYVEFMHGGGHPVLLGQLEGYPTLTNNTLKVFEDPSVRNVTRIHHVGTIAHSDNQSFVLAVFNVDGFVRADSIFEWIIFVVEAEEGQKRNLKPALIILAALLSALSASVMICTVKVVMHRRESGEPNQWTETEDVDGVATTARWHSPLGLDKSVVDSFPTITVHETGTRFQESQCAICLSQYAAHDVLRVIPNCAHTFHLPCADKWLQDRASCPVCREALHDPRHRLLSPAAAALLFIETQTPTPSAPA